MRAAVIPTHDRASDFADCVEAIRPQVDEVIALAHGADAYEYALHTAGVDGTLLYGQAFPNISTMWRMGLDATDARWVAFLNDDAIVGPDWFDTLESYALSRGASGASGWRAPDSEKIAGFAFILDATSGVRPDERFRWWYSDDAIQKRCESHSAFALHPEVIVEHRHPNKSTQGTLRQISRADRPRFRRAYL